MLVVIGSSKDSRPCTAFSPVDVKKPRLRVHDAVIYCSTHVFIVTLGLVGH